MVHGAVRKLFTLFGALIAGLLIALPLFAWRLASGPIELDFLTPYIEEALTAKDGAFSVDLETTVLALGGDDQLLEIRAVGVQAYAGGEQPIAVIPELSLTLNGRALLAGELAPKTVRLYRPKVRLVRDETGRLQWGIGEEVGEAQSDEVVRRLIDALIGEPDPSRPGRHLLRASVVDADVQVEDLKLGVSWHATDADVDLKRTPAGLSGTLNLELDLAGEAGSVHSDVAYRRDSDEVEGSLQIAGIRPAVLARLGGPLAQLAAIDMPLAGSMWAKGTAAGSISEMSFDLAGGAGQLNLPAPADFHHRVASIHLRGGASDGLTRAQLDELFVDLEGPTATLSAVADGLGGRTTVKADAVVHNVPFDALPRLWPEPLARNARDWVVKNMSAGIAREARATISAVSASGRFDDVVVDHIGGTVEGSGVTVDYLSPMPVVKNAAATANFDAKDFRINIKGGEVYGLKVKDGLIILGGLDQEDQFADIDLNIAGPAADALKLIDHKPLGYAKALGIDPAVVGGDATTRLRLKFPLLHSLKLEDVAIKAHASLKGATIPKVAMGLDLSKGDLELDVDAKGLDASGPVVLGSIPADLKWRENFSKGSPFRSRYILKAPKVDEAQRVELGLDSVPFIAPFMEGAMAADVVATLFGGGRGDIEARLDLSPARMRLPGLGWRKEERTTGGAEVLVRLDKMKVAAVPRFSVQAGDLQARGSVTFAGDGQVRRVDFDRLSFGRTDINGSLQFRPNRGGIDVAFKGKSFNAEPVIGNDDDGAGGEAAAAAKHRRKSDLPPMSITGSVDMLWLSAKGGVSGAALSVSRDADDWRHLSLRGTVGEGKPIIAEMKPAPNKRRDVRVVSDDAGAVARAFDVYDDLVGGKLEITGYYDDSKEEQPITGTLHVSDYNVVNAPALARLLTVAALTGVVDLLNGEGVSFSGLDAPFTLTDGLLQVRDARAYGPALGITAKGEIDLDNSRLALEGTVVPAYALNSVLGKIPLFGWLVTGGEKGGGLVAFNFSMKGPTQEPDVVVNPLSALTPGFLRHLFNIFDDGTETEARKRARQ